MFHNNLKILNYNLIFILKYDIIFKVKINQPIQNSEAFLNGVFKTAASIKNLYYTLRRIFMAVASMIFGILALIWMVIPIVNLAAPVIAIVGIILGVVSKKKLKAQDKPSGKATAGIVMSIIALAVSTIVVIACTICIGSIGSALEF